jgi:hypothetical protein
MLHLLLRNCHVRRAIGYACGVAPLRALLESLMEAIRNMNWTWWVPTFIVLRNRERTAIERDGARRVGLLSRVSPCLHIFASAVVSAFAGAVPAQVRSHENCPPFTNRSNQT